MSIFTLIKYPVDKNTQDFTHLPDDIWDTYMKWWRNIMTAEDQYIERNTNAHIIKILIEWEDPES